MRKKTHKQFMEDFKEKQPENYEKIDILTEYINSNNKIKCRCKIDGYEWDVLPHHLLSGSGCHKCSGYIRKSHKQFMKEFEEKQPENFKNIEVLGEYKGCGEKIKCRCKIDNYEWEVRSGVLLQGYGCPKCKNRKTSERCKKTHKEFMRDFKERCPETFEKIEVLGEYERNDKKIKCRCKVDGYEWEVRPISLLMGYGCPKCNKRNRTKTHEQFMKDFEERCPENFEKIEILNEYVLDREKILCKCNVDPGHGKWWARPNHLLRGHGCPKCTRNSISLFEQVIYEAFKEVLGEDKVLHRDKSLINKELDIYIPSLKIAFEPGSWFWHSDKTHNDYDKFLLCKEKGVKLITIYDGMREDFDLEFEYNVVKYEKDITKEEMKEFVANQIKELDLKGINFENLFFNAKKNKLGKTKTHKEFIRDFKKRCPENYEKIDILTEYINTSSRIKCKCKIDGHEWEPKAAYLIQGAGCPECAKRKRKRKRSKNKDDL